MNFFVQILFVWFPLLFSLNPKGENLRLKLHPKIAKILIHQEVTLALEKFETELNLTNLSKEEKEAILEAVWFSAKKHKKQTRKNKAKTPYIVHPLGVAQNILSVAKISDPAVLKAALLHDTVEDTSTSFEEIRSFFGEEVERLVREVTDDKTLPRTAIKELQVLTAPHKSRGAALIKLADKLYNLQDILKEKPSFWSEKKCDEYYIWAEKVVSRLPSVSPELELAVKKVIQEYWHRKKLNPSKQGGV